MTEEKFKELQSAIDVKLEKANNAAIEASKQAANDAASKQTEGYKAAMEDLQKSVGDYKTAVDKMHADQNKRMHEASMNPWQKAIREHKDALASMASKDKTKSVSFEADLLLKDAPDPMTAGNSIDDARRVIPYQRVVQTPVFDPEERPLRNYISVGSVSSDSVEWHIEKVPGSSPEESYDYDENAGAVNSDAAGAKPQSDFEWGLETLIVRDIAHFVTLHKNLMADLPLLETYLPQRLRDGILRAESKQILTGQNSQRELVGLDQTGSHAGFADSDFQAALAGAGKDVAKANFIDILGYSLTQLRLNNYSGSLILVNPEDYYTLMFAVNDEGTYHMMTPLYQYVAQLVVQSNYVTKGKFFTLDAARATTLFQRAPVAIDFSYENSDNFVKNLVTIRAEERAVLVTERPNAVIYGDFGDAVAT